MGHHLTEGLSVPRTWATRFGVLATGGVFALLVGLLAVVDPHTPGHYPTCPFHAITGLWCPGCGGLRAVHDLAHGQVVTALHENVLVVLLGPALVVWWLVARHRRSAGRPIALVLSPRGTVVVLVLLGVFAVVRNLPFGAGLAP